MLYLIPLFVSLPGCPLEQGVIGTVTRQTAQGTVIGEHYLLEDKTSFRFRGIPYAQPPVGDLRLRPPHHPANYSQDLEAFEFKNGCLGSPGGDEDCLYLNIWTPDDATLLSPKPVMFYIHGGGNNTGSSSEVFDIISLLSIALPPELGDIVSTVTSLFNFNLLDAVVYDGHRLASGHDVVVVTINYRLGPLGNMAHPSLGQGSGNFAYLDMHSALSWVQDNISQFGGDPNNVTVFGESAGAWNTCALLNMPAAKGLFHKAIMQSMFCASRWPGQTEQWSDIFLRRTGCKDAGDTATCLRRADPASFFDSTADQPGDNIGMPTPTIDGTFFPQPFYQAVQGPEFNHVPLIFGATRDEFFFVSAEATDQLFNCPMSKNLEIFGAHLEGPIYRYGFNRGVFLDASPAFHALDTFYVFGSANEAFGGVPTEEAFSKIVRSYWANFAHRGNPNGTGLAPWPQYDLQNQHYISLQTIPTTKSGSTIQNPANCGQSSYDVATSFMGGIDIFW